MSQRPHGLAASWPHHASLTPSLTPSLAVPHVLMEELPQGALRGDLDTGQVGTTNSVEVVRSVLLTVWKWSGRYYRQCETGQVGTTDSVEVAVWKY